MKKAISVSIVVVTVTGCFLFSVHVLRKEAGKTAQGAIELVKQVLNITPEVTITTYVTRQKTADIFELASISKEFPIEYHYENKQYGSTKRLDLLGEYIVKAGFDLRERFSVQVDQTTHRVRADFPAPKILSVEQKGYKITKDDGGLWNRLAQKDQEFAVNDMHARARANALELRVREDTKESLRRQLLELAKKTGQDWDITFRDARPIIEEPQNGKL